MAFLARALRRVLGRYHSHEWTSPYGGLWILDHRHVALWPHRHPYPWRRETYMTIGEDGDVVARRLAEYVADRGRDGE